VAKNNDTTFFDTNVTSAVNTSSMFKVQNGQFSTFPTSYTAYGTNGITNQAISVTYKVGDTIQTVPGS
jgi:hypothetical protein